jgi:hypothetical protein
MERQRNELTETKSIVLVAKVKVQSPVEYTDDFDMFKLHWKRILSEAIKKVGEVKYVDIIT